MERRSDRPQVVVLGAGFAGIQAVRAMTGKGADIVLIDRTNHHLFQPLLYQVATAGLSPANIAWPIRSMFAGDPDVQVHLAEVLSIDRDLRQVLTDHGDVPFDFLVVATGATHSYFGHEDWESRAPGLKTLDDAVQIRRDVLLSFEEAESANDAFEIESLLTTVVVGAGPTGVEMAGSLAELSHRTLRRDFRRINPQDSRVILIEAGDRVLPAFNPALSERAAKDLREMGVDVRLKTLVEQITPDGVIAGGDLIRAKNVIWAAGVQASGVGFWLGVETDRQGRVPVNAFCELEEDDRIYVVGDCAHFTAGSSSLPGLAPVAMQQGKYVGQRIASRLERKVTKDRPFVYRDRGIMATIGRKAAVMQSGKLKMGGFVAWVAWLFVHLMQLVTFRNRLMVLMQWGFAYFTHQRNARIITHVERQRRAEASRDRKRKDETESVSEPAATSTDS